MIKKILVWSHRWLTLLLLPLFALIIVTGAILSFAPMIKDASSGPEAQEPVEVERLLQVLARVDPQARSRALEFEEPGIALVEFSRQGQREWHAFQMETGQRLEERAIGADFFHTVQHLHKHLLLDLDIVVDIATYLMVLVIIVGPLLSWPRLRHTLVGWHTVLGWVGFPLVLMVSATGVMMALSLGTPQFPAVDRDQGHMPMAQAIERAVQEGGLTHVRDARRMQTAAVAINGQAGGEAVAFVVTRDHVTQVGRYPGLVTELHEGTWAGGWSGALNLLASALLMVLMLTGLVSWGRRGLQSRRRTGDADADILVAWASQTGTAARLAQATTEALRDGGARVMGASLAGLDASELKAFRRVYLIASTAGDGQVPEPARSFLKALEGANLKGVRFAVLALGDSSYTHFCAGGLTLRDALRQAGAEECLPLVRVDREPAEPWTRWLQDVGEDVGVTPGAVEAPRGDQPVTLTLKRRQQLNDPDDPVTHEVWSLDWRSAEPLTFRPGDLLLVAPGEGEPGRPYSIGSSSEVDPRRLLLTVALTTRQDAKGNDCWGKASGLLCRGLKEGDTLDATLRPHPDFNPPEDPARPMIMIAAGCGIAPFVGFLEEQAQGLRSGPAWLIFGNRKRAGDYFHGERLERWRAEGVLTRLDAVFSRDPDGGGYVQDLMRAQAPSLWEWLHARNAVLYACGNAKTLGEGVRKALGEVLMEQGGLAPEEAQARLRQWEAEGRLCLDLID
ncbi:PepSY domain-containing protein [Ectothiorhodospira haloalkaliphila]|uniref:PepSY domain-containing protein n=1 Tax=Ectothiorhodospira haloalkaliphila TaxID=421628 RepID=UPI001EE90AE4|nr:PepSY domain-containing protein [Ectothiorhodospira haloalkaliphila]MCG5523380.1 PepSY domain-containing protein [Ectothiorhodospira haloalkaliphila]